MKKLVVLSAVLLLLLALAQADQAATLSSDWYAKIQDVNVYTYGEPWVLDAFFPDTPPGDYPPFQVTDGSYHNDYQRYVFVPETTYGVGSQDSLIIPVYTVVPTGSTIAYLTILWQTNYDPSQMHLEFWRTKNDGTQELLWSQLQGGQMSGVGITAYDTLVEGPFYFKVSIVDSVPEVPGFACFIVGLVPLFCRIKGRR